MEGGIEKGNFFVKKSGDVVKKEELVNNRTEEKGENLFIRNKGKNEGKLVNAKGKLEIVSFSLEDIKKNYIFGIFSEMFSHNVIDRENLEDALRDTIAAPLGFLYQIPKVKKHYEKRMNENKFEKEVENVFSYFHRILANKEEFEKYWKYLFPND